MLRLMLSIILLNSGFELINSAILRWARSVADGNRTYGQAVVLRAIHSLDAMTAEWVKIPYDVLDKTAKRICSEVKDINRVVMDVTSNPPATIEWE